MYKEIYDLVEEFTNKNEFFDFDSIVKIINCIAPCFGISNTDVSFSITDSGANYFFSVNPYIKRVFFDRVTFFKYNSNYPVYFQNLIFIKGLVHELEHVKQYMLLSNLKKEDIKDSLLKLEYILNKYFYDYSKILTYKYNVPTLDDLKVINELDYDMNDDLNDKMINNYHRYHDYALSERFADVNAALFMINLIETYEKNEERKQEALAFYKKFLYGIFSYNTFTFFNEPSYYAINFFLYKFGFEFKKEEIEELEKQIEESYKLDDDTRLKYGLGVTLNIYSKALDKRNEYMDIYKDFQIKRRINNKLNKIRNKNNK